MLSPKRLAILGATGSIGVQTLDVIRQYPDLFQVEVLTARRSASVLIQQALEFKPNAVVMTEDAAFLEVKEALADQPIKVYKGMQSLLDILHWDSIDLVLNALVGFAGLEPTLTALKQGKAVALANKETLVAGGELVMKTALENHCPLLPVDSEHSAIFQCLQGEHGDIEKILLTASGGPFFQASAEELGSITKERALKHPTWTMGAKVTIDSATLMNKGLEVIEAYWLFGEPVSKIEVVVHPQSLVHSMVQFVDGSVKAQLSCPDMRLPIQYALTYPQRLPLPSAKRMDFAALGSLHFFAPPTDRFPCLPLAFHAIERGGNIPCAMNAANEVAVDAFLHDKIAFTAIPTLIERVMQTISYIPNPDLEGFKETHKEAQILAQNLLVNT